MQRNELQWIVGHSGSLSARPDELVQAKVPGAVQLDWAKAHGWDDYTYADNYKEYAWMEDVYWHYYTNIDCQKPGADQRLFFVCGGVDYEFCVKVDGKVIHEQEGMFTPFALDITDFVGVGSELEIVVFPAPKREGASGRAQADQCCKPAVSYGWDWHPRLIPLGIWEDTYLEYRSTVHISDAEIRYQLSDDFSCAHVELEVALSQVWGGSLRWSLLAPNGQLVASESMPIADKHGLMNISITNPELWWPNGEGDQALYESVLELVVDDKVLDIRKSKVGIRKIELVLFPGAHGEPFGYPKSRYQAPITIEINGRRIFSKGTNWLNPEIFPGIMARETYRPLLELARDAHFNLLRSWGGGVINKESFFELCDEMGLMVWQEFPLACNDYAGTQKYLTILDQESKSIIKRLRRHACVVMWVGGNELFNGWSGMTDQSLALRLLNRNCYDLDPKTPYMMTSPLEGMAHGHYSFKYGPNEEIFHAMPKANFTAYAEFGCPGPSAADYIRKFIPEEELWPPKPGTAWETHHAFNVWQPTSWLMPEVIEEYFGPSDNLEEMVEKGQILQAEGFRCIYEEARRQWPRCSMALNWCFNEPWPSAANNNLVNWPAEPKPSYYAVKAACRPILASARIPKFSWREGEFFNPELWVLSDMNITVSSCRMTAFLRFGGEELHLLTWETGALEPKSNLPGPIISYRLPHKDESRMTLVLKVDGMPEMTSEYTLVYKPSGQSRKRQGPKTMNV